MLAFAFENPYFQSDCKDTVFPLKVKTDFSHFFDQAGKRGKSLPRGENGITFYCLLAGRVFSYDT